MACLPRSAWRASPAVTITLATPGGGIPSTTTGLCHVSRTSTAPCGSGKGRHDRIAASHQRSWPCSSSICDIFILLYFCQSVFVCQSVCHQYCSSIKLIICRYNISTADYDAWEDPEINHELRRMEVPVYNGGTKKYKLTDEHISNVSNVYTRFGMDYDEARMVSCSFVILLYTSYV